MSPVFIGRQPILDQKMRVFACELSFHQGLNASVATRQAILDLIAKTQEEVGFDAIVGKHAVVIKLPLELIKQGLIPQFEPEKRVVLEIPNHICKDVDVLRNLKELKSAGSTLVLGDFWEDESSKKLVAICDFVKVDVAKYSQEKLRSILTDLHAQNVKVIADRVETEEQFQSLKLLGFNFFRGYFFTNPLIINGEKLSGSKLTLLQLLTKVNDDGTDFNELSKIIGHDVGLTHKLLVAVNNPTTSVPVKVNNIADALKYMGLKRLKFWVNMLMLSRMEDAPQVLLVTSLTRARFCELLAHEAGFSQERESYFLAGLFSNLSAFFRAPIEEILVEMPLSPVLCDALIHRKGSIGAALNCLTQLEQADNSLVNLQFQHLDIVQMNRLFISAASWAQRVVQD